MEMVLLGRLPCMGAVASPSAEDERKARAALELAGIPQLAGRLCSRISGGEYQLVVLARALASEPELLILDEPESNLDFRNQARLLGTVASLCRERGMSALFSTHYPEHALELSCKSLLVMPDGSARFGASVRRPRRHAPLRSLRPRAHGRSRGLRTGGSGEGIETRAPRSSSYKILYS